MPTDLPKNFAGSAPKGDVKSALKGLGHSITHHLFPGLAYEYAICYLLTGVASSTLLGNSFNQPAAALGVMALGILVRHFTRQPQAIQLAPFGVDEHQADSKPSPYL